MQAENFEPEAVEVRGTLEAWKAPSFKTFDDRDAEVAGLIVPDMPKRLADTGGSLCLPVDALPDPGGRTLGAAGRGKQRLNIAGAPPKCWRRKTGS